MLPDPRGDGEGNPVMQGDHGHSPAAPGGTCGAADTSRDIHMDNPEEQLYWCDPDGPGGPSSGHVMTATPFTGYGILSISPRRSFTNVQRVCWDQNLTMLGGRRWTQMVVVPEGTYQSNWPRLDYASPGFGPDSDVGHFNLDSPAGGVTLKVFMGHMFWYPDHGTEEDAGAVGAAIHSNADKATRYTHCIEDLNNGSVRITQERPGGGVNSEIRPGGLPDGQVRVLFQDDRYDTTLGDSPITWHWDNIEIS